MPVLLGVDLGTLGLKAVLVNSSGHILASGYTSHGIKYPQPGWAEQDPEEDWWREFVLLVKDLLARAEVNPSEIAAIGISGLVPALCLLGPEGVPLRPALLYCDNRAGTELQELKEKYGMQITLEQVLPKLLWLKKHEPEVYERGDVVLNPHSYIVYRLTGCKTTDVDTANIFGGLFDPGRMEWRKDLCRELQLNPQLLPEPLPATAVAGTVTRPAASVTGLAPGTPVITGTGDSFATLLAAGVTEPGELMLYLGTTGTAILVHRPLVEAACTIHISDQPSTVEFCANILACGQAINWYRHSFFPDIPEGQFYGLVEQEARLVPPGAQGLYFLPHLMGRRLPRPAPMVRGTLFGLTPLHRRPHIFRGLLEGIAYEFKQGYLRAASEVTRVVITGGGARNRLWRQILSDVLGREIDYPRHHNTALGTAYLAGYAIGIFGDFSELRKGWNPVAGRHTPDTEASRYYQRAFASYLRLNEAAHELYESEKEA
ncbi:FGGY family carbohydrate kinase [Moorellaceae bacterium AZ2]